MGFEMESDLNLADRPVLDKAHEILEFPEFKRLNIHKPLNIGLISISPGEPHCPSLRRSRSDPFPAKGGTGGKFLPLLPPKGRGLSPFLRLRSGRRLLT